MRRKISISMGYSLCLFVLVVLASCSQAAQPTTVAPKATKASRQMQPMVASTPVPQPQVGQLSPVIDQLVNQVLLNIREHGWNPSAQSKGQQVGGLFINWKMNDPTQTNALKQGSDGETAGSHDPQVDLYYLNALALHHTLHPQDHSYDGDIQKATRMVQTDFPNYNIPKGWIYFYLLRTGTLLHNTTIVNDAYNAARNFYANWYDPGAGLVYNRAHSPGVYNTEHALNCAAALIDAGKRWNQTDWVNAGISSINHVLSAAIDPQHHLFYNNLTVSGGQQQVLNHQAKPSTQGNSVEALVTAYNLTHDQHYMDVAGQILHSMFEGPLWDQTNGGLFFALNLDANHLNQSYKETRGQTLSLIGLYHYNLALARQGKPQELLDKQQGLIDVLTKHFYESTYHGYFYRMTPTYQVYHSAPGTGIGVEDYFTTEAMGTAMDALQQTEFAQLHV